MLGLIGCQIAVAFCWFGVFEEPTLQFSLVTIPRRVRIIVDGVAYAPHRCGARGFGQVSVCFQVDGSIAAHL
jgi:hypothetical protein